LAVRAGGPPADEAASAPFRAALRSLFEADAGRPGGPTGVLRGRDGWLFAASEARSLSVGPFWGDDAARAGSPTAAPVDRDPLPAIRDFHAMLRSRGIALIVVPVPAKICVHADRLDLLAEAVPRPDVRPDPSHRAFFDLLEKDGIAVVDLLPDLRKLAAAGTPAFLKTDTHWSPPAVRLAAERIAAALRASPVAEAAALAAPGEGPGRRRAERSERKLGVRGDLARMLDGASAATEAVTVQSVKLTAPTADNQPGGVEAVDRASPVVLMGDSFALAYHAAVLVGEGDGGGPVRGGLPDHLAAELGRPVDLVASMGGGANAGRIDLARRRDNLAGKRVVIWVFAARELTESPEGWKRIPVIR
jgi:alginate O-acetyltransferase complex protein AlgJ